MIRKLLFFIFLSGSQACQSQLMNSIDSIAQSAIEEQVLPSLAIGIVQNGKILSTKAYGYADVEKQIPANTGHLYQLGSVTKTFTGMLLAHLVAEGKMNLQDSLSNYFPEVKLPRDAEGRPIRIIHLATHTACIPRYPANLQRVDPDPIRGYSLEQMYADLPLIKPDTLMGTRYHYSNYGYGILATAMERATGQKLNQLFKEYIFEPLEMRHSSLQLKPGDSTLLATPYLEMDPPEPTEPWNMEALAGAGNLFSNIKDLSRFMIYMMQDTKVNRLQQKPYFAINENWSYGLGCFLIDSKKYQTRLIHHGGDIDGYASYLLHFPELNQLGIIILTNHGSGQAFGPVVNELVDAIVAEYTSLNFESKE